MKSSKWITATWVSVLSHRYLNFQEIYSLSLTKLRRYFIAVNCLLLSLICHSCQKFYTQHCCIASDSYHFLLCQYMSTIPFKLEWELKKAVLRPGLSSAISAPLPETQRAEGDYECPESICLESASWEGEDINHMAQLELYPIHSACLLPLTGLHDIPFWLFFLFLPSEI